MIEVTLPNGVTTKLDLIPSEISRLAFVCAFIDSAQMRRLMTGKDSAKVCSELGLDSVSSEKINCESIENYYKGVR